jgi:hypothetical protein
MLPVLAAPALAEQADEHVVIGPEQAWIEVFEGAEIMWVGPNQHDRTQVLSGHDIEIVATWFDAQDAAILGARAMVAVMPASHSCENLKDPLAYYVISLDPAQATDGPATFCGEPTFLLDQGAILFEEDPMRQFTEDGGQYIFWVPGQGFTDRLE